MNALIPILLTWPLTALKGLSAVLEEKERIDAEELKGWLGKGLQASVGRAGWGILHSIK